MGIKYSNLVVISACFGSALVLTTRWLLIKLGPYTPIDLNTPFQQLFHECSRLIKEKTIQSNIIIGITIDC